MKKINKFASKGNAILIFPFFFAACRRILSRAYSTCIARLKLYFFNAQVGNSLSVQGRFIIKSDQGKSISIADHVTFISSHDANMVGLSSPVLLQTLNKGKISIGAHSGFSSVVLSSRHSIQIGEHVKMGGNVRVYDHDYHSLDFRKRRNSNEDGMHCSSAPVIIGNDVFIGTNSLILKGVEIGDRSIIGTGSVVTKSVPTSEIWAGNPAVFLRKIDGE